MNVLIKRTTSKKGQNEMKNLVIKNIIITILLFIVTISLGLLFSFLIVSMLPGDPVLAYLAARGIPSPSQAQYDAMVIELGFNQPLIVQYLRYIGELFTRNWGVSISVVQGEAIRYLLTPRIQSTLEFMIIPIVLGLILGIIFGVLSINVRNKWGKILIQILVVLGISMPIFLVGMIFQYIFAYQLDLYPGTGVSFLPILILELLTMFLTMRQVRSNYLNKSEDKSILSNNLQIIMNLIILIVSIILIESTFDIDGFFGLFIRAIRIIDYWLVRVIISIILLSIVIILLLFNIGYIIYNYFLEESKFPTFTQYFGKSEQVIDETIRYDPSSDPNFKEFIFYRLKSPLTIIGMAIVVFFIIVAIFPQVLTPLSMNEALSIYPGEEYGPPSATHPLGQTTYGRDVLALIAYGVSSSMKVYALPVLIGIGIGVLFGYVSKLHWGVKDLVLGFMVIQLIPTVIMIFILPSIMGSPSWVITNNTLMTIVIPGATLVVSNGDYSLKLAAKKLIIYFPLFMAFTILLNEALGFIGITDPSLVSLGYRTAEARLKLFDAPWAALWPGIALYVLVIGFISLHYGLKEPIPITERILIHKRTRTSNGKIIRNE